MTHSTPPADIGVPDDVIETPALVVDLEAFERNLHRMEHLASCNGVKLRPHAKAHKAPAIAQLQLAAGAIGVCCQKVSEAQAFVRAGTPDVLVTNQIVDIRKLERLSRLAQTATVTVCVDHPYHIDQLALVARTANPPIRVLVELNVGGGRCGVAPGPAALTLAAKVLETDGLVFAGLQAYHGPAQHLRKPDARRLAISQAVDHVRATRELLARHSIECVTVSGGGTGTFLLEAASGEYTEIQAGSYLFMDMDYAQNEVMDGWPVFDQSLFVYTTVISEGSGDIVILDAGLKALAIDSGYPAVLGVENARVVGMSDEHTKVALPPGRRMTVGERVILIPSHVDPTVNLHEWYVGVRRGRVETLWPISARGPGI